MAVSVPSVLRARGAWCVRESRETGPRSVTVVETGGRRRETRIPAGARTVTGCAPGALYPAAISLMGTLAPAGALSAAPRSGPASTSLLSADRTPFFFFFKQKTAYEITR